ncbi:hypothetical protein [Streptomyces chryseus]|uniref:hypothetical protein n=1 Tax=Streptomyces chryseus TaxID=68186 RepID=UPI00110F922C|nr:hypothetical protein [Streptomyces chryseus]GGX26620.1 hypothetical protein GCM10010353_47090 [Streptomyces chryseus]
MSIEVRRGTGEVVMRVRDENGISLQHYTPAAARLLARRLTTAARDVEAQIPQAGEGWELQSLEGLVSADTTVP